MVSTSRFISFVNWFKWFCLKFSNLINYYGFQVTNASAPNRTDKLVEFCNPIGTGVSGTLWLKNYDISLSSYTHKYLLFLYFENLDFVNVPIYTRKSQKV